MTLIISQLSAFSQCDISFSETMVSDTAVCNEGNNLTIQAEVNGGPATFSWTAPDNSISGSSTSTGQFITVQPTKAVTIYTIVAQSATCSIQETIRVRVTGEPDSLFTPETSPMCLGVATQLVPNTTTMNYEYQWDIINGDAKLDDDRLSNPNIVVFDGTSVTVELRVEDLRVANNQCVAIYELDIPVIKADRPSVVAVPQFSNPVCPEDQITFFTGPIDSKYTGLKYQWYKNDLPINGEKGTILRTSNFLNGDQFALEVSNFSGCVFPSVIRSSEFTLEVVDTSILVVPTVTISSAYQSDPNTANFCPDDLTTFYAEATNIGDDARFEWYVNGAIVDGERTSKFTYKPEIGDQVYARVRSGLDCVAQFSDLSNTLTLTTYTDPAPAPNNNFTIGAINGTSVCSDGADIQLEVTDLVPRIPNPTFDWTVGAKDTSTISSILNIGINGAVNSSAEITIADTNYTCFLGANTTLISNIVGFTTPANLTLDIDDNNTIENELCANDEIIITAGVSPAEPGLVYTWYYNNSIIPFERGNVITISDLDSNALIYASISRNINCSVDAVVFSDNTLRVADVNPLPDVELVTDLPDRILCENGDAINIYGSFIGSFDDFGNPEYEFSDIYSQIRDTKLVNLVDNDGDGIIDSDNITVNYDDIIDDQIIGELNEIKNVEGDTSFTVNVNDDAGLRLGKQVLLNSVRLEFSESTSQRRLDTVKFTLVSPSGTRVTLVQVEDCRDSLVNTTFLPGNSFPGGICGNLENPTQQGFEDIDLLNELGGVVNGSWRIVIDMPDNPNNGAIGTLDALDLEFLVIDVEYDPASGDYTNSEDATFNGTDAADESGVGDVLAGTAVRDTVLYINTDPVTGCSNSDTIFFKIVDIPKAFAGDFVQVDPVTGVPANPIVQLDTCINTTITLGGGATTNISDGSSDSTTAVEGTPPYTYSWETDFPENVTIFSKTSETTQVLIKDSTTAVRVTIVDFNGCESDPSSVTLNAFNVKIANDLKVGCEDDTREVTAVADHGTTLGTGDYAYAWMPDTLIAKPDSSETEFIISLEVPEYTIFAEDNRGCKSNATLSVQAFKTPKAQAGPIEIGYCDGDSVQLGGFPTAIGGVAPYTINWFPKAGLDDFTESNPFAKPGANIIYTLNVTDAQGCLGQDSILVRAFENPTAEAGPGQVTLCKGSNVMLGGTPSANGGTTPYRYRWTPTVNLSNATLANPFSNSEVSRTYSLTVIDVNGCEAVDSIRVNINNLLIDAGDDKLICQGDSVSIGSSSLVLNGVGPFNYGWKPGNKLDNPQSNNPVSNPESSITYTVTVRDGLGCEATDVVTVEVSESPVADAGDNQVVCKGDSVTIGSNRGAIGGFAPYRFNWGPTSGLDDNTIQNPKAGPKFTRVYSLVVTDSLGCVSDVDEATVIVAPELFADAGDKQLVCVGQSGILGSDSTAFGGTAPFNYVWEPRSGLDNFQKSNPKVTPTDSSIFYTVTISDGIGCTAIDSVEVVSFDQPIVQAGENTTRCLNAGVRLGGEPTASGGSGGFVYDWSPKGTLTNATLANPTAQPSVITNYTVIVTDQRGCTNKDEIRITPVDFPTAFAGSDVKTCLDEGVQLGGATLATGGTPPYNYKWIPEELVDNSFKARPTAFPLNDTTYTLTVVDQNNCFGTSSLDAKVNFPVSSEFEVGDLADLILDFTAEETFLPDDNFIWNFGDGFSGVGKQISHTYLSRSIYDVCLTTVSLDTCYSTTCKRINLFAVNNTEIESTTEFKVYPNPTQSSVSIEWENLENLESVVLVDMNGKRVQELKTNSTSSKKVFEVSDLPNGVYTVLWNSKKAILHRTNFIKQ